MSGPAPRYLNLGPTATYQRRRAGWFPGGENRLGKLRLILDKARRSTDTTEVDEYAVQEETDFALPPSVRSFLLENLTDPDEYGPFRCIIGGMQNWCGCEAGWFDQSRPRPTGCKHRDSLAALVQEAAMDNFETLLISLDAAVELRILELERAGGPGEGDFERVRGHAQLIASQADVMMFGSKPGSGKAAEVFNALADALAVMAFVPGGVRNFAGRSWAVGPHNKKAG